MSRVDLVRLVTCGLFLRHLVDAQREPENIVRGTLTPLTLQIMTDIFETLSRSRVEEKRHCTSQHRQPWCPFDRFSHMPLCP